MGLDPATTTTSAPVLQGIGADLIATSSRAFSREDVDAHALRSQQKAAEASGGYRQVGAGARPERLADPRIMTNIMRPDTTRPGR